MSTRRMWRRLDRARSARHGGNVRAPVDPQVAARRVLALADQAVRSSGHPAGTDSEDYRSPEEVQGTARTSAGDVFSLGLLLYEQLTGRRRFEGPAPWGAPAHRLFPTAADTEALLPRTPAALRGIVARALATDPAQRYPDIPAFAEALRRWFEDERAGQAALERHQVGRRQPAGSPRARQAAVLFLALGLIGFVGMRSVTWLGLFDGAAPSATPEVAVQGTGRSPPAVASPPESSVKPRVQAPRTPQSAVRAFYRRVERAVFDRAHALLSNSLRSQVSAAELAERYGGTTAITLEWVRTTRAADGAVVAVQILEETSSGDTQRLRGWWRVVRQDGAWVLDLPSF